MFDLVTEPDVFSAQRALANEMSPQIEELIGRAEDGLEGLKQRERALRAKVRVKPALSMLCSRLVWTDPRLILPSGPLPSRIPLMHRSTSAPPPPPAPPRPSRSRRTTSTCSSRSSRSCNSEKSALGGRSSCSRSRSRDRARRRRPLAGRRRAERDGGDEARGAGGACVEACCHHHLLVCRRQRHAPSALGRWCRGGS